MTLAPVETSGGYDSSPAHGSPHWWLIELTKRLLNRRPLVVENENYYKGEHRLAYATEKFRKAFGPLFTELADNWCEVVVDACEERLNVEGFRFGESPDADGDAWEIWQRNYLDADSQLAHIDMLVAGCGYGMVWGTDDGHPVITVESPLQCIVAHEPGSRRKRAAGLKQWKGDDGRLYAVVYLPDTVGRFRSAKAVDDEHGVGLEGEYSHPAFWESYSPDSDDPIIEHPIGKVPLVPLYNRPRSISTAGRSELETVKPLQDVINKDLADLILASEYSAYRQRWATGLTLDRDDEGNTIPPAFKHGPGNLWVEESKDLPGAEATHFGEFGESNLQNMIAAIDQAVSHLASQSRTPPHYLSTSADRLSGESIKSAETGLVSKCKRKFRFAGEAWEELMRLAFAVEGDKRAEEWRAETVWRDPESRTEAEHVDATLKKKDLGVPLPQLWEDLGYTPTQIARFEAMRARDKLLEGLNAPPPAPPAQPGTQPGTPPGPPRPGAPAPGPPQPGQEG